HPEGYPQEPAVLPLAELMRTRSGPDDVGGGAATDQRPTAHEAGSAQAAVPVSGGLKNAQTAPPPIAAQQRKSLVYTANRKWTMSPSCTTYSLPSRRSFPASRHFASLP